MNLFLKVVILGFVTAVLLIIILILVLKVRRDANRLNTDKEEGEKKRGAGPPCSVCCYKMTKWRRMERRESLVTQSRTIVVRTGDTITLQCSNVSTVVGHAAWFKQVNGSEPVCISTMHGSHPSTFRHNDGFKSSHLEMYSNNTTIFLKITNVDSSDSGLYFCGMFPQSYMVFVNATFLKVQGKVDGTMNLFLLVVILGVVAAVLLIIILILDTGQEPDSLNYAALSFCQKRTRNEKTAKGQMMEMEHVVKTSLRMRCYHQRRNYTMTQLFLIFLLMFKTGSLAKISQSDVLKTFLPGDRVHLECLISEEDGNYYIWIKMIIGRAPVTMLSVYTHSNTAKLFGEFNNSTRFTATKSGTSFVLTISDARPSDMGMNQHLTQQPVSESVQTGDSVTLNCTIHTETCAGEHSVYWFRHGSGESRPGIIYTHGDRSDQCEKNPEAGSPTQNCVYNLPKRNLSLSDAGTYYCAVASCGEILFGKGTKLDVGGPSPADLVDPKLLALIVSNILSLMAIVVLLICMRRRKGLPQQPQSSVTAPSCPENERDEGEELNYAAMSFSSRKTKRRAEPERQTRERDMNVVYS
ncbi:unnamed protein product, partial [Coregonus sp. 'balchen']